MVDERSGETRRMDREIAIFEGQGALHQHDAAFRWRNEHFVGPAIVGAFGLADVAGVYAESIARAVARCGLGHALSLGCGDGSQEIEVLKRADELGLPSFRILGVDVAPAVVARANAAAAAAGFVDRLAVVVADANSGLPGEGPVAAIMVHHALHHFVALEPLLDAVAARLHPEGAFVTFDMIGRNGHMRWPEIRPLVRRLWAMLPREKRRDHQLGADMPFYQDWDCAIEGFEGVRAQDILGVIATRFRVGRFAAWGGLSDAFFNTRAAANFDIHAPADLVFLERVMRLEQSLLETRRTTPTEMVAEFRSLHSVQALDPGAEAAFRRALRQPDERFDSLAELPFESPFPPQLPPDMPVLAPGTAHPLQAGSLAARALQDGFAPPETDGVWAILDEQALAFRTPGPTRAVRLHIWNPLPSGRGQEITVVSAGCATVVSGPLSQGDSRVLTLVGTTRDLWEIRLFAGAYRLPDLDGGEDKRPLAYRLAGIEPQMQPTPIDFHALRRYPPWNRLKRLLRKLIGR